MLVFIEVSLENLHDTRGAVYAVQSLWEYIIWGGGALPALCFVGSLTLAIWLIITIKNMP
jgi:hypothetical protein